MEHIVKLIDSLAWPIAAIWLGYIFRGELQKLLGRMSQVKYKDLEAKFEKNLESAEKEAKKVAPDTSENKKHIYDEEPIYPDPYAEKYEQLLRIAEESPRAALLEAWVEVEKELLIAAENNGIKFQRAPSPRKLIIELINTGQYVKTILPLFEDLRKLRNDAAHVPEFMPTNKQTRRYLQLAIELALTFQSPLKFS
ncbi:hypothetical protein [Endozoicomonas sp.]|uniref:hypothetical protein n=1 Tax=Endozoicomonas sp. TaxID=1892382 RepID=UPI003AF640FC